LLHVGAVALALSATTVAFAQGGGGTAKPPTNKPGNAIQFVAPLPIPPQAFLDAAGPGLSGFDVTGLMQDATVALDSTMCKPNPDVPTQAATSDPRFFGGSVKINGITITIPCNTIVQMPANTFTWSEFVNAARKTPEWDVGLDKIKGFKTHNNDSPMHYEVHVVGNTVGTDHIGALVYISQISTSSGSGVITRIDYAKGRLEVANNNGGVSILEINDPIINKATGSGTFGLGHSPDERFSVDNVNPTVHSGTGYPMCVPRTDPTSANPDNLCPELNRPKAPACRNFGIGFSSAAAPVGAGLLVTPKSAELAATPGTGYCKSFVMPPIESTNVCTTNAKNVTTCTGKTAGIAGVVAPVKIRTASQPDARRQAPLEVGDYITFAGTLFQDPVSLEDFVSVHTLEANVGIFTQPGTQPAYISIGEFGLGPVDPPVAPAAGLPLNPLTGVFAEATNRFFLEASTTDIVTPVDIYIIDMNPADGSVHNRWVTPFEMTNECDPTLPPVIGPQGAGALPPLGGVCQGFGGGITTQFTGPQNMRARIRAIKPPLGLLNQPSRYMRVVQRSLCLPTQLTGAAAIAAAPVGTTPYLGIDTSNQDKCIADHSVVDPTVNPVAAGSYLAPVFEYIFPENTQAGQAIVPSDLWDLPFLVFGDGPGKTGPLQPVPW
jgi:hypothetical protein